MKTATWLLCLLIALPTFGKVRIKVKSDTPQAHYAATRLSGLKGKYTITISVSDTGPAEGYTLSVKGKKVSIIGNDANGTIHGANGLLEQYLIHDHTLPKKLTKSSAPKMVMRGACVGLQKTTYLPGHKVYEYPYTPENFPWFYDKQLWLRYLDLLAENDMNSVYLWNGHPFASLIKLDDYPFAPEVDDATMAKNQEMFDFLTTEANRRGIRVIQMFYNIIVSKPFADHYGIKTQDRNRPITPLIADYTRKSIAAFVQKYPDVGFLVCLGEAMSGIDTDIEWMTGTIIPGIKDGLAASGRTDTPPIILRSHDTDGPKVLEKSLPLYPNIYTMSKYTGESLTTYEPGGPWGETHRQLAAAAPVHIDNVHILANLEPWRWSSPAFIQKAVGAMHKVHHSKGLHLYPQANYWEWPYTADKLKDGSRLLQIDRDWMWYKAWGRYAWDDGRNYSSTETDYWKKVLAEHYDTDDKSAERLLTAYDEMGEIAPKFIRRFGITEGNRQTLLLGMKMSQLVNPYKYNIYPGFYESCGPPGEKLIEFVEKSYTHERHVGELPLKVAESCLKHAQQAVASLYALRHEPIARNKEFIRLYNDACCYLLFTQSFRSKIYGAQSVLLYKFAKDKFLLDIENAIKALTHSLEYWSELSRITDETYYHANSMQTAQRRIPIGGNNGKYKTWSEMLPIYEEELENLKVNFEKLREARIQARKDKENGITRTAPEVKRAVTASCVTMEKAGSPNCTTTPPVITLQKGARLFEQREEAIDTIAPELEGLQALILNRDTTRIEGTRVVFDCDRPVQMLVGFFMDDDPKWASPPKLETDATGNEYGQAEPIISNAIHMKDMPIVNIHAYHFKAGHHDINLPRGIIMVAGFTTSDIKPRDANLQGAGGEIDWLFQ